jgi:hypothetical protein
LQRGQRLDPLVAGEIASLFINRLAVPVLNYMA